MSAEKTPSWLLYALASGACASFNGVFAKLTTTQLTTTWATSLASTLQIQEFEARLEIVVRSLFFLLNLAFNGVMWGLFTRAIMLATGTVRVSVINTSANFLVTAVLGAAVFRESLPALWWLGASLLVAGSVIIGRRDEGSGKGVTAEGNGGLSSSTARASSEAGTESGDSIELRHRTRSK